MSYLTDTATKLNLIFSAVTGFELDADTFSEEEGTRFELDENDMIKLTALMMELDELRYRTQSEDASADQTPLHVLIESALRERLGL